MCCVHCHLFVLHYCVNFFQIFGLKTERPTYLDIEATSQRLKLTKIRYAVDKKVNVVKEIGEQVRTKETSAGEVERVSEETIEKVPKIDDELVSMKFTAKENPASHHLRHLLLHHHQQTESLGLMIILR